MFGSVSLPQIINRINHAENEEEFQNAVAGLKTYLKEADIKPENLLEVERRVYYLSNKYSDRDTKEKIEEESIAVYR